MKERSDVHVRFRELIAARLDRSLTRVDLRALTSHLKGCAACQQVEREYRAQRELLRALPTRYPPRDLWARTSAALDREVARGSYRAARGGPGRSFGRRRAAGPTAALMTTVAALGLITAISVMNLAPVAQQTPSTASVPTPFGVPPQRLAFVGSGDDDIALYSTQVSRVCPPTAAVCDVSEGIVRTPVVLPHSMRAHNIALSPSGYQLALVGRSADEDFIAVVTMPQDTDVPGLEPLASGGPSGPAGSTATPPSPRPSPATDAPGVTPGPSAGQGDPAPTATAPPASAVPGLVVLAILEGVDSAGAPPAWSPSGDTLAFSAMPTDGAHGPDVYIWRAGDARARPITNDHGSFFASWAGERIVASRIVPAAAPDAVPDIDTVVIDPMTQAELVVDGPQMWLPAVNQQGSLAVAWYGDLSWSNGLPSAGVGALYLVDWTTLDPYATAAPTESPTAEPTDSPSVEPSLSPPPEPTDSASSEPTESPTADPSPTDSVPSSPGLPTSTLPAAEGKTESTPTPTPSAGPTSEPTGGPASQGSPAPGETPTIEPAASVPVEPPVDPSPTPEPTKQPTADATPEPGIALDPDRDPRSAPVVDWQVRWSTDGHIVGIWIADVPGSSWGRLVVLAINPETLGVTAGEPLLGPTLARRGFTLGLSRVAWVGPSEGNTDGELRIRTWGSDGVGGLRLQPPQSEQVMPAF